MASPTIASPPQASLASRRNSLHLDSCTSTGVERLAFLPRAFLPRASFPEPSFPDPPFPELRCAAFARRQSPLLLVRCPFVAPTCRSSPPASPRLQVICALHPQLVGCSAGGATDDLDWAFKQQYKVRCRKKPASSVRDARAAHLPRASRASPRFLQPLARTGATRHVCPPLPRSTAASRHHCLTPLPHSAATSPHRRLPTPPPHSTATSRHHCLAPPPPRPTAASPHHCLTPPPPPDTAASPHRHLSPPLPRPTGVCRGDRRDRQRRAAVRERRRAVL